MSESDENKLIEIIRNCLSEEDKKKVLSVYEKYEKDSDKLRNSVLNGEESNIIPIISVNFGWTFRLPLHKHN